STNDTLLVVATGQAQNPEIVGEGTAEFGQLFECVMQVAKLLAQAIVRDGEGATKFITITVDEGATRDECLRVGKAIGNSPLVKTAFFASDPNLGRILAAVGNAGIPIEADKIDLYLDDVLVAAGGSRHPAYREEQGVAAMRKPEFKVRAVLNRGKAAATLWT